MNKGAIYVTIAMVIFYVFEDNAIFTCEDTVLCFYMKAYLVFHWCLCLIIHSKLLLSLLYTTPIYIEFIIITVLQNPENWTERNCRDPEA